MTLSYGLVAPGAPQGIETAELKPGLVDPVHDSQRIFRALLEAMAHPGRSVALGQGIEGPLPLDPATAAAALTLTDYDNMPRLALFAQGLDPYPDCSATILLQLPSLADGPKVTLSGPGIRETAAIAPAGLPGWFWNDWRLNAAQFPLGVDIFLTCGEAVIGLPRSILAEG